MKVVLNSSGSLLFVVSALVLCGRLTPPAAAADPFAENVRTTEPLSPEEEQKAFRLPPGFTIQLVASEPQIQKPMNMAFDEKGRLWITDTREYPYPLPAGQQGRDTIKILEDTDGDGRADKITTFAEGLNIPIGLYPWKDGVIAWSIPNIWHFRDLDGDGKADRKDVLYGPLGWERDVHGNNASFRRGFDGWLYITHGYNNNSTVRGKDGSEIRMNSGNTYRVRLDGSRVEQFTWGQVNPFGMCFDPLGNIFTADCHSSPLYQLLRGGYYPSFGKPHDGLGFVPEMVRHSHGSTAIAGIVFSADDRWPDEFRENFFVGNVMTSRVNRDSVQYFGSTLIGKEEPDLVVTEDPWFRPVDLQLGPDGALYIADFYNRIIGHYEVPLDHPGRDRERGRIWRLIPPLRGEGQAEPPFKDLTQATLEELAAELASGNITRRLLATHRLVDGVGRACVERVQALWRQPGSTPFQRIHGLWVLHRLNALPEEILAQSAKDTDRGVRTHAMRVLAETPEWDGSRRRLVLDGLEDPDAFVQRAAADALGQHPAVEHVRPLLALEQRVSDADTHLRHMVRIALRNQLRGAPASLEPAQIAGLSRRERNLLADVAIAVPHEEAARFLLGHIRTLDGDGASMEQYFRHCARYLPASEMEALAATAREKVASNLDLQLALFKSVEEGAAQRGAELGKGVREWGAELAGRLFESVETASSGWRNTPVEGMEKTANPWFVQQRPSADGKDGRFLCSLPPGGETLTGVLRSDVFRIPRKFSFYMAGHDGFPGQPRQKSNRFRLRSAETGEVLAESFPPRNDVARLYSWDLEAHAGKDGYLEIVDGNTGTAYAWLAVGRFDPPVVALPQVDPLQVARREQAAVDLARTLSLTELEPKLKRLVQVPETELETRSAAARALLAFHPNEHLVSVVPFIGEALVPAPVRNRIAAAIVETPKDPGAVVEEVLRTVSYRMQLKLAQALAGSSAGSEILLATIDRGQAPPTLLLDRAVREKLAAQGSVGMKSRIDKLTAGLSPISEEVQRLIEDRRKAYLGSSAEVNPVDGARVFAQTCGVCHQIDGQGGLVGPQLDGIGNRGLERLLEDILDPNRNVDNAFRTHIISLKDGEVASGLPRREEGELLVLADSTGKEFTIPKGAIDRRRESEISIMPDNFGDVLSSEDFNDLLAFLLSKRGN